MCIEKKITSLVDAINKTFEKDSIMKMGKIIEHDCNECNNLELSLRNLSWNMLSDEVIELNYDKLPLLTHQAFHYFFPSFLRYSLKNFDPDSNVCEFTIYSLTPGRIDDSRKEWWHKRFLYFSKEQRQILFEFLNLVLEDERFYNFYTIVERGKKRLVEIFTSEH